MTSQNVGVADPVILSFEKKRYAALVLAQSWQTSGMLWPMALPSCASSLRNLSPSRASLNSHPAISRSIQHRGSATGWGVLFAARSLSTNPMEHLSLANQVLSNKSQAIFSIQDFAKGLPTSRSPNCG